jgi:hypothetical protein
MIDWNEIAFHLAKLRLTHPEVLDKELPALIKRAQMRLVAADKAEEQRNRLQVFLDRFKEEPTSVAELPKTVNEKTESHTRYIMSTLLLRLREAPFILPSPSHFLIRSEVPPEPPFLETNFRPINHS